MAGEDHAFVLAHRLAERLFRQVDDDGEIDRAGHMATVEAERAADIDQFDAAFVQTPGGRGVDLRRSLEVVATCPLTRLDRRVINEEAVAGCLSAGEGHFIAALQHQLRRRHLTIRWYEHDLLSEITGQPLRLQRKESE